MEKLKRYIVFLIGLFINSLGVSLITKANLGTSPISSIPYVLSLNFPFTLGQFTIAFSLLLILIQLAILRRNFKAEHVLQIPISILFGWFIDLTMGMLFFVRPHGYISSLIYLPLESTGTEAEGYEILLPPGSDADNVQQILFDAGYISDTYETMYSSIYVNAVSSIRALYAVFMVVAFLAAYFASDAAEVYTQKDRRDIRVLMMLGASESMMRSVYLRLTMTGTLAASILGTVTGVVLGALSPYLFRILASCDPALLSYYVTSFTLSVPWGGILLMMVMMLLIASLSVFMTLRKLSRSESAG